MKTELRIDGANCPICLDEMLDQLRDLDGVNSVTASITAGCIAIDHTDLDHTDLDPDRLTSPLRPCYTVRPSPETKPS